jgi:hypothetical protein
MISGKCVVFVRHGANHDWYKNHSTGICEAIPRHKEIKEQLAKKIIKPPEVENLS